MMKRLRMEYLRGSKILGNYLILTNIAPLKLKSWSLNVEPAQVELVRGYLS